MKNGRRQIWHLRPEKSNGHQKDPLDTVREIASETGISPSHLRKLLSMGAVEGIKLEDIWLTRKSLVEEYLNRR